MNIGSPWEFERNAADSQDSDMVFDYLPHVDTSSTMVLEAMGLSQQGD